jgi:hypothetical protein
MTSRAAFIALAASFAARGAAVAATAEPAMTWEYSPGSGHDLVMLAYGVEGTEMADAILRCRPGSGRIVISTFPTHARQGVVVRLRAGAAASRRASHVEPNEASANESYLVATTVPARDPVVQAFRRGAKLSISVGRQRTTLPAAPRAMTAPFFRRCG